MCRENIATSWTEIVVSIVLAIIMLVCMIVSIVGTHKTKYKDKVSIFLMIIFTISTIGTFASSIGYYIPNNIKYISSSFDYSESLYSYQENTQVVFVVEKHNGYYYFKALDEKTEKLVDYKVPVKLATIEYDGVSYGSLSATKEAWKNPHYEITLPHDTIII